MSERNITVSAFVNSAFVPEYCRWEETANKKMGEKSKKGKEKRNEIQYKFYNSTLLCCFYTKDIIFWYQKTENEQKIETRERRKKKFYVSQTHKQNNFPLRSKAKKMPWNLFFSHRFCRRFVSCWILVEKWYRNVAGMFCESLSNLWRWLLSSLRKFKGIFVMFGNWKNIFMDFLKFFIVF